MPLLEITKQEQKIAFVFKKEDAPSETISAVPDKAREAADYLFSEKNGEEAEAKYGNIKEIHISVIKKRNGMSASVFVMPQKGKTKLIRSEFLSNPDSNLTYSSLEKLKNYAKELSG